MAKDWDSLQYLKFERERTLPPIDLVNRVPLKNPQRLLDIGCGPGNSTAVLAEKFPDAQVLGIDSSENMIEKAKQDYPNLSFSLCDAGGGLSALGSFDLVFSNACIQWIPDHERILTNWFRLVKPGGVMALQIPMSDTEPIHTCIDAIAARPEWAAKLPKGPYFYSLTPEGYHDVLVKLSSDVQIWKTTYYHALRSHNDLLEWYRGTGLRPYLNPLSPEDQRVFLEELYEDYVKAYPKQENGDLLFRFPRLFFLAVKDAESDSDA